MAAHPLQRLHKVGRGMQQWQELCMEREAPGISNQQGGEDIIHRDVDFMHKLKARPSVEHGRALCSLPSLVCVVPIKTWMAAAFLYCHQ